MLPRAPAAVARMLRVNHAGEQGAAMIYKGQLAVLGRDKTCGPVIQEMAEQEQKHLDYFATAIGERRVRPTALMPLWNVAGYALGVGTALLGKEAAMMCTVAVEDVIVEHYNAQLRSLHESPALAKSEEDLRARIREFRDEEQEHHDTGIDHDAERAPLAMLLKAGVQTASRTAIWLSERV